MIIVGAGLAGLMAGVLLPESRVIERNSSLTPHRAVLRFRSPRIGDVTGIPFKEVTVRKGIWFRGKFVQPNILVANLYSKKTNGSYMDRSIWKTKTEQRWIAPTDFQDRLAKILGNRLLLGTPFDFREHLRDTEPTISTAPMEVLAGAVAKESGSFPIPLFTHTPIHVERYKIESSNVYQTIYFPDSDTGAYRASITGDSLSIEYTIPIKNKLSGLQDILFPFGLQRSDLEFVDEGVQKYGKILPLDDRWRKNFILQMTLKHNIYSLGRFATWRQILLDDVLNDIYQIKAMISGGPYSANLRGTK